MDVLQIVSIPASFRPLEQMQLLNLWDKAGFSPPAPVALAINNSNDRESFVFYASSYFNSGIWRSSEPPLEIIQRGTPIHKFWQKQVKALKGDAIVLGTETSSDTLLYWDGKAYRLYLPPEQP
jgi:hypothetical protein